MSATLLIDGLEQLVILAGWAALAYFVLANGFYVALMLSAAWELRWHIFEVRGETRQQVLSSPIAPRVSVLVPAHNEAETIEESVRGLLTLAYPNVEIIVVNDGSTDDSAEVLNNTFELSLIHPIYRRQIATQPIRSICRSRQFPNLVVAEKDNGGKADTLNAALSLATGELVCAIDADTIIEEDALQRLVRPFLRADDVVAAGATIRAVNGCDVQSGRIVKARAPRNLLAGVQAVEYLRAFLFGRVGWNRLGGNLVISGAFGMFRRDALLETGGYAHGVGEDIELIARLRRRGHESGHPRRVEFVPDPVAWTEVPSSLRVLARQRNRWHRGLSETLWRHRSLLFRRRYRALGLVVYPAFAFIEWLAPIAELLGLVVLGTGLGLGWIDTSFALLYFLVAYGIGVMISAIALTLEELSFQGYGGVADRALLLGWAVIEGFGYRQLTVWWRLRGIVDFLRGRNDWGAMERVGFSATEPDSARGRAAAEATEEESRARAA